MTTDTFVTTEVVSCAHASRPPCNATESLADHADAPTTARSVRQNRHCLVESAAEADLENAMPASDPPREGQRRVTLTLRPVTFEALRAKAEQDGRSLSSVADQTLNHHLVGDGFDPSIG